MAHVHGNESAIHKIIHLLQGIDENPNPINRAEYVDALILAYGMDKFNELCKTYKELKTDVATLEPIRVKVIQEAASKVTPDDVKNLFLGIKLGFYKSDRDRAAAKQLQENSPDIFRAIKASNSLTDNFSQILANVLSAPTEDFHLAKSTYPIERINAYLNLIQKNPKVKVDRSTFVAEITDAYGCQKLKDVAAYYKIDLSSSKPLTAHEILQIKSGVEKVSDADVDQFIRNILVQRFDSERERDAYIALLPATRQAILEQMQTSAKISRELREELKQILKAPKFEYADIISEYGLSDVVSRVKSFRDYIDCVKNNPEQLVDTKAFIESITEAYGKRKVDQVLTRYKDIIDISKPTLKASQIRKIQVGLNDINQADLNHFLRKIIDPSMNFESTRESAAFSALAAVKPTDADAYAKMALLNLKGNTEITSTEDLPPDLFRALMQAFRTPTHEFEKAHSVRELKLEEVQSMPGKPLSKRYFKHGWFSHTKGRGREDEERVRLYKELEAIEDTEEGWHHYNEILAKLLVKKHLYNEESETGELSPGMLIPAPKGKDGNPRWYRVDGLIDSGLGKFAYHLVAATKHYDETLPDIILYRSSATLPAARDSFSSYLNDIGILPPAYLSASAEKQTELDWMTKPYGVEEGKPPRPLILVGHSLGGSHCQTAMLNLQHELQAKDKLLPRSIELSVFDSPAIKASDAQSFADWVSLHPNKNHFLERLKINYYVSAGDPIPSGGYLFGSSYLGGGIQHTVDNKEITKVHEHTLRYAGKQKPEIACMSPHDRMTSRGINGRDYTERISTVKEYDKKKFVSRLFANFGRAVISLVLWPTLGTLGGLKRWLFGRRHQEGVVDKISNVFKKNKPPAPPLPSERVE